MPRKSQRKPEGITANDVAAFMRRFTGLPCWYVSGGATGSSFSLAMGEKVRRKRPLLSQRSTDVFSTHHGEASLYVWCAWRLDGKRQALASSDQHSRHFMPALQTLVGKKVVSVRVSGPACDVAISFADRVLRIFCDHVPPKPSFDGNWEAVHGSSAIAIGPGYKLERDDLVAQS